MKVVGFDGREYPFSLGKYEANKNKSRKSRSKFHLRARNLLYEIYSSDIILEEIMLPGSIPGKRGMLSLDFFIPNMKLGIEVHGQQHYEFTPFFHRTKADFLKGQFRDRKKMEWCELNEIRLTVFKYSETDDEWRDKLPRC